MSSEFIYLQQARIVPMLKTWKLKLFYRYLRVRKGGGPCDMQVTGSPEAQE
jgi:hypothetical protein